MRIVEDLPQPEGPRIDRNDAVRAFDVEILHGWNLAVFLPDVSESILWPCYAPLIP